MKASRRQKKKSGAAIRVVILACVAFAFFKFVQLQVQLNDKQAEIDALAQRKDVEMIYIEDLQNKVDSFDDNLEQYLRQDGYVGPSDQVYQFVN